MKKSNLATGIVYLLAGILLLITACRTDSVLGSLLFGFAGAGIGPGIMMIYKYFYWSAPKNRARYQELLENEKIEQNDELKIKLRDKSGRYAYLCGLMVLSVSMVVFSILGKLGIIDNPRMLILYLGGYLVFQIVIGIAFFNHLLKRY